MFSCVKIKKPQILLQNLLKEQPFIFCLLDRSFIQMSIPMFCNELSITFSCECHCLKSNTFSKIVFALEVLGVSVLYAKRYLQEHQWSAFFFRAQITQILFLSRMPVSERSEITVWERHLFENFFCYKFFGMCLPYMKRYFQEQQSSAFFFRAQIIQILLFSGMLRSKVTVWEQHLFQNVFVYGRFWNVPTLHKKVFSGAPVK